MNKLDKVHEPHSGDQIRKSREGFGKYFGPVYSRFLMISIRVPFLPQTLSFRIFLPGLFEMASLLQH